MPLYQHEQPVSAISCMMASGCQRCLGFRSLEARPRATFDQRLVTRELGSRLNRALKRLQPSAKTPNGIRPRIFSGKWAFRRSFIPGRKIRSDHGPYILAIRCIGSTAPIDLARLESAQWRTWSTRIRAGERAAYPERETAVPSGLLGSERRLRNGVQQCRDEDGGIESALTMQSLLRRETGRLASG